MIDSPDLRRRNLGRNRTKILGSSFAVAVALTASLLVTPTPSVAVPSTGSSLAGQVTKASAPVAARKGKTGKAHRAAKRWMRWVPPAGASFNTPRSSTSNEYRNEARVVEAIRHARKGSVIRMVMFSFDRKQVSDALIAAYKKRNVTVQVIVNGHEKPGAQKDMDRAF
ncbi:MAG: hypothetical protein Q7T71_01810, partial [Herbiconiux sp.]|nr:hypothetical protein [Herbiconiux sp.]